MELDDNYLEDQINNATQNNVLEKNQIETKFKAKGGAGGAGFGTRYVQRMNRKWSGLSRKGKVINPKEISGGGCDGGCGPGN